MPILAVLSLPLLFAAGMSLVDTADGVLMTHAYGWAFRNPLRRVYYNITVTGLSVAVAFAIGTVELLQVAADRLALRGSFWASLERLELGTLGYGIVALFALTWAVSVTIWKMARFEDRWQLGSESSP